MNNIDKIINKYLLREAIFFKENGRPPQKIVVLKDFYIDGIKGGSNFGQGDTERLVLRDIYHFSSLKTKGFGKNSNIIVYKKDKPEKNRIYALNMLEFSADIYQELADAKYIVAK